jgi:hypothetical protein
MSANRTGKRVKKERTLRNTTSNLDVLFCGLKTVYPIENIDKALLIREGLRLSRKSRQPLFFP